jgi:hypothetical protein
MESPKPLLPIRITLVSDYLPQDAERHVHGAFQRLLCHVSALRRLGEVDFIFLWPWERESWSDQCRSNLEALRRLWRIEGRIDVVFSAFTCQTGLFRVLIPAALDGRLSWLVSPRGRAAMDDLAAILDVTRPDLIFAHRMGAALPVVRQFAGRFPILVDFDDVEHVRLGREASRASTWQTRLAGRARARLTRRLEGEVPARAKVSLVCSAVDAGFLQPLSPRARLVALANSSPLRQAPPALAEPVALFVGMAAMGPMGKV